MSAGRHLGTIRADPAELLERALGYTSVTLSRVRPEHVPAATPCPAWDLERLLHHMVDSLAAIREALGAGDVGLDPAPRRPQGLQALAALRLLGCGLAGDLARLRTGRTARVGGVPVPLDVLAAAAAVEVAVHGWDVAAACGGAAVLPAGLACDLLVVVPMLVDDEDRPGRFGPALPVRPSSGPGERLLAYLGRGTCSRQEWTGS
jgi:uncharacterized protein (TIGR03086 family)